MAKNCVLAALVGFVIILAGCGGGSKQVTPATPSTFSAPTAQAVQVVVDAPQLGNVLNPLNVKASATSPNGIKGWVVYVDNNIAFQVDNFKNSISTSLPLVAGNHTLYVRAWDQLTQAFGTSPTLEVGVQGTQATVAVATPGSTQTAPGSTGPSALPPPPAPSAAAAPPLPPSPGPLPDIPGEAKIWGDIQNMDGWDSCSACAGGDATTSNFWTAGWEGSPSRSGSSREFFVQGPPWTGALWIKKLGAQNWAAHFLWDFWVRFDDTSAANVWTAEYDFWQSIGGQEFMIGSHCNFGENHWDIWDSGNGHWMPTDIACPRFSPNEWHHIQWYFERWGSLQYHYGILIVDGNVHNLDRTFNTNTTDWSDGVGVQWQLDQNGSGAPLHEWIDNVKLAIW